MRRCSDMGEAGVPAVAVPAAAGREVAGQVVADRAAGGLESARQVRHPTTGYF